VLFRGRIAKERSHLLVTAREITVSHVYLRHNLYLIEASFHAFSHQRLHIEQRIRDVTCDRSFPKTRPRADPFAGTCDARGIFIEIIRSAIFV